MQSIRSLLAFFLVFYPHVGAVSASERPNLVLVMCDDLGWGDVGFNGGKVILTPHLDEMARSSLVFSRFYAQAPVCSPTRGSCLTGRHPYRYDIPFANAGHMKPGELTLAEVLKSKGYRTGHFGKWHLGTLSKTVRDANRGGKPDQLRHFSPPQDNGFDVCFSTESKVPTYDPMLQPKSKSGDAWNSIDDRATGVEYGTFYWDAQGTRITDNLEGDDSRVILDRAVPFIEAAAVDGEPFFAVIWFHTPHLPVVAGPKHRALYPNVRDVRKQNYFGCVTAMDEQIGRLRETLKRTGVYNNTLVTFCSDNGPEGNSDAPGSTGPFRGRKRSLYEGGVRVPALIEWPNQLAPAVTNYPATTSDYLPTILELLDIEESDSSGPGSRPIDGVSLLSLFRGEAIKRPKPICFQSQNQLALSDHQFKIYRSGKNQPWELYDLLSDPSEKINLADTQPEIVDSYADYLTEWQKSCSASSAGADYSN